MNQFEIYPLQTEVVTKIKESMRDEYGNELEVSQAISSRGVCRRCLQRFNAGDERILFKYKPFQKESVFAEIGPVYVHTDDCRPAGEPLTAYPEELRELPLLLRAYNAGDGQVVAELIKDGDAESILNKFFDNPAVAYIHLRDGEYGCYIARIERSDN